MIINKEDGENHWLIEALVPNTFLFDMLMKSQKEAKVFVTITKKQPSRPADGKHQNIVELERSIQVLIYGQMVSRNHPGSESILESLVKEGYSGSRLIEAFKQNYNHEK